MHHRNSKPPRHVHTKGLDVVKIRRPALVEHQLLLSYLNYFRRQVLVSTSRVKSPVSHILASYELKLAMVRTERPSKCVHMHRSEIAASERSRLYSNDLPRNGRTIVRFTSHKKRASSFTASFAFDFSLPGSLRLKCLSPAISRPQGSHSEDFATPSRYLHIA